MKLLLPKGCPRPKGYANGITVTGRQVYIAWMIGWDAQCEFDTDDFGGQVRQALQNTWSCCAKPAANRSTSSG